ncbi:hypothetical protein AAG570_008597 [Ranatra chinensis]|uniref:Serine/threonine-protein phosphatase 4 regulatory subunit 2 n=1 Tax=Ranatra chinensis TaxID=642074 RepID=A0ABD0YRD4_9HEMI
MDNPEEILHSLEEFSKMKPKDIPRELDDYLSYVAKTGDPVFKWSITKCLFREKLLKVITDFYESTLTIDLPPCPNVDPFNYERMKTSLLEKLDTFHGAPFTVQRISELLTNPRKEYNRADKFMRAIEKNILVVSTREPGRYSESDMESSQDTSFNGTTEPADSPMETSFPCNDLPPDPDSSSPSYEIVNSESQDSTYNSKVDGSESVSSQFSDKTSDSEPSKGSSPSGDEAARDESKADECETVICSTVTAPQSDSSESENSNEETTQEVQLGEAQNEKVEESDDKKETEVENSVVEESPAMTEEEPAVADVEVKVEGDPATEIEVCPQESEEVTPEVTSETVIDSTDNCEVKDMVETEVAPPEESQSPSDVSSLSDTETKQEPPEDSHLQERLQQAECSPQAEESVVDSEKEEAVTLSDYEVTEAKVEEAEGEEVTNSESCVREASVIHATASSSEQVEPPAPESMDVEESQIPSPQVVERK